MRSFQYPVPKVRKTRFELAEARTEQAEVLTEEAKTRTEAAETRADQAETRAKHAETRTERAETRTEQAETRTERAETRTERAETRTEQAETRTEQAETRTVQAETRTEQAETRAEKAETAMGIMVQENADTASPGPSRADMLDHRALGRLTARQRDILQFIAKGENTKQMAGILKISSKTVEYHRMKMMTSLDMHDVSGLVRFALRVGLISAKG